MPKRERGFVKLIILIVILLAILAYWGFDVKEILSRPEFKEKILFIWNWIKDFWLNYIWHWVIWLWDHAGKPVFEKFKDILIPKLNRQAGV